MFRLSAVCMALCSLCTTAFAQKPLQLTWEKDYLTIAGEQVPGKEVSIHYLEAYCRAGSTDADWVKHTLVGHKTELISQNADQTELKLRCRVSDGVIVDHTITSTHDEVRFALTAHNPTDQRSEAHWAQPCIRLDRFTGADQQTYLRKSFVFVSGADGKPRLSTMPTPEWATKARYIPGQVWCPAGVDRNDVNPRPLNDLPPANGLIGCFSADDSMIFATAFEPFQELFQGVIVCLHSDFRLGGLHPGETKQIKGRIYIVPNDLEALLTRYQHDFPEHTK